MQVSLIIILAILNVELFIGIFAVSIVGLSVNFTLFGPPLHFFLPHSGHHPLGEPGENNVIIKKGIFWENLTLEELDFIISRPGYLKRLRPPKLATIDTLKWLRENWDFFKKNLKEDGKDPITWDTIPLHETIVFSKDTSRKIYSLQTIRKLFAIKKDSPYLRNPFNPSQKFTRYDCLKLPKSLFEHIEKYDENLQDDTTTKSLLTPR